MTASRWLLLGLLISCEAVGQKRTASVEILVSGAFGGTDPDCRVISFKQSGPGDEKDRFRGLLASGVPYGTYKYELQCGRLLDFREPISGQVSVFAGEILVVANSDQHGNRQVGSA